LTVAAWELTVRKAEPADMRTNPILTAMAGNQIFVLMLKAMRKSP
jgi:hypothetical protein